MLLYQFLFNINYLGMRYEPIDPDLFIKNRKKFTERMLPKSVAIFNSNDEAPRNGDQYFPFRQHSDIFYLSGINQEQSILVLAPDFPDPKLREILFMIETNEQIVIWNGYKLSKEESKKTSGIKTVFWHDSFEMEIRNILSWCENIYLNSYEYPKYFNEAPLKDQRFTDTLQKKFPLYQYKRAAPIMTGLRSVKSQSEIELIRKAIEITGKAFERILKFVKPGVKEYEIQAEIEHEFLMNRANGNAYQPVIASGKNACILHYIENDDECKDGDLVLFDFGAEYANYAADISRTIPVNGKFSPRQRELYEVVLRIQKRAIEEFYPGNTMEKYNKKVNKWMEEEMIRIGLFTRSEVKKQDTEKPLYKKYLMHGTAHHLGLDVHDLGLKYEPFRPGNVFTCEPGIYIGEEGIGIRIENNILITENGPFDLTAAIPREIDEIEAIMEITN